MKRYEDGKIYMMPSFFGPAVCEIQAGQLNSSALTNVTQYVMAYRVNGEDVQKLLPEGFHLLRPVLRINLEMLQNVTWLCGRSYIRVELNTPVECKGKKGWLNLVTWENDMDSILYGRDVHGIPKLYAEIETEETDQGCKLTAKSGGAVFLEIQHIRAGVAGGCPKENDNDGTFHLRVLPAMGGGAPVTEIGFMAVESIGAPKEYCNCTFKWFVPPAKKSPAFYPVMEKIAAIACEEILGAYVVNFDRVQNYGVQIKL